MYKITTACAWLLAEAQAFTLTHKRVIALMNGVKPQYPNGARLDTILKAATEMFKTAIDPDDLLIKLRYLYRAGRILHSRDAENKNLFRTPDRLKGLTWMGIRDNVGMFLDVREKRWNTQRSPIVGWLNYRSGLYSARIVSDKFRLSMPIPVHINNLDDAVHWVLHYGEWIE